MAGQGRKPTPNAILKQRGTRAARKDEVEFVGGFGPPPEDLKDAALEAWHEAAKELEHVGMGSTIERNALACYCRAVQEFWQANREIDMLGSVIEGRNGYSRNPACLNQNAAMEKILKFAIQFGMTPASRKGIEGGQKKDENPMADL